jgi:hypothetical protein
MFAMCDLSGAPLYRSEPWRGLLPFFEHANIAEEQAMEMLQRHLVVKTLTSVLRLLRELPRLQLRLVCAIDESGCGCELLCPPPRGQSVGSMMREVIGTHEMFADLRPGGGLSSRLHLSPVQVDASGAVVGVWEEGNYSSCHLPQLIGGYYEFLAAADESAGSADGGPFDRKRSTQSVSNHAQA